MPRDVIPEEQPQKPAYVIVPPRPRTKRDAQNHLTYELIRALQMRPETFKLTRGGRVLEDKKSGMDWWVGNGPLWFQLHNVADCSCTRLGIGFINKFRAWIAFKTWLRSQDERPDIPHIHEAERLAKINRM